MMVAMRAKWSGRAFAPLFLLRLRPGSDRLTTWPPLAAESCRLKVRIKINYLVNGFKIDDNDLANQRLKINYFVPA
jgi:hypothetical protein